MPSDTLQRTYTALYNRPGRRATLDELVDQTGLSPPVVVSALDSLIKRGLISDDDAAWIEDLRYRAVPE